MEIPVIMKLVILIMALALAPVSLMIGIFGPDTSLRKWLSVFGAFLMIPVQCEYYALEGLSDLLSTVRIVKKKLNPGIAIEGVLLTMYDGRTNLSIQVAEEVKRHFPGQVYATVIPRNVRLSEAPSHGKPALAYDKFSRGAEAYQKLAEEILEQNS